MLSMVGKHLNLLPPRVPTHVLLCPGVEMVQPGGCVPPVALLGRVMADRHSLIVHCIGRLTGVSRERAMGGLTF